MSDAEHSPETAATVAAYDAHAEAYAAGLLAPDAAYLAGIDRFAGRLPAGARVLEIGSGSGGDALLLEERGLVVQRTDISVGFVQLLEADGHDAWHLDPLVDDLRGPWDAVYASACLLHVERTDLPVVLSRLHAGTVVGGVLLLDLKEGDGERWSTHGSVPSPRHFTFWREGPLRKALESSGWVVESVEHVPGRRQSGEGWLHVTAVRPGRGSRSRCGSRRWRRPPRHRSSATRRGSGRRPRPWSGPPHRR